MYLTLFVLLCFPLVLNLEDFTQCSRPCDLILSCRRRIPPTIPPEISSVKSENYLLNDKTRQGSNLTGKYIMEIFNCEYLQYHIATFKLEYRSFECKPQRNQLSNTFQFTIEEVFETLETADVYTKTAHYSTLIRTIANRSFGNTFHHHNGLNHR